MDETRLTPDEERLARMMKALGNPFRMWIVRYLREHPECITGDIVAAGSLAQATVSQHLKVLREAGLIEGTLEGAAVSYCLDEKNLEWLRQRVDRLL